MKNKLLKGRVYSKLIRRLFYQTFGVLAASAFFVILLRVLLRGKIADGIVETIRSLFRLDWYEALSIYDYYIRSNLPVIITAAVVVFFFILFRLVLVWFTKYFNQIVDGVDKLTEESEEEIMMSPELDFMQTKLNEVRLRLQTRRREAQEAEQRKNDMLVYLAHDIKTPLTSVIGYLTLLDEARDMPPEQRTKYVHIALDKAYRLEELINEFFEITRYNLQSIPLSKQDINLCYMFIQLIDELYPQLVSQDMKIDSSVAEDLSVNADPDKLARVFNNVLKNAIAYGEAGSTISINAGEEAGRVIITIKNKGTIPQDKLSSIFEKFYRLDTARSSATGGAGLGLAIAKDIISLHGGSIGAYCEEGCTIFKIELPLRAS